jgi:hypothetical protein
MLAEPYRANWVNQLQRLTGVCLVMLAVLDSADMYFASAGFVVENTPLKVDFAFHFVHADSELSQGACRASDSR